MLIITVKKKNQKIASADKDKEKLETYFIISGDADWCSCYVNQYGKILKILRIELLYNTALPLLSINQKNWKQDLEEIFVYPCSLHRVIHNGQEMERTQCSWTSEWINKILHMFAMEYYSIFKKRRTLSHVTTWMKLENIMLSKASHIKRDMTWFHIYAVSKVVRYIEIDCGYQGLGVGREVNGELLFSECKVSVL